MNKELEYLAPWYKTIVKHKIELSSADIITDTLSTGELPKDRELVYVTAIIKQGSRTNSATYRPVSLTSIYCKMLEHIVLHNMQECLNELSVYQHGFRKHMSCTTQLACVTHDLMNNFDRIIPTHAAVLDFSKPSI